MNDLDIVHNKIRCPYCKDAYMQFDFVVPHDKKNGQIELEIFMSCEKTIEKLCSGRMRINANAGRMETWESLKKK